MLDVNHVSPSFYLHHKHIINTVYSKNQLAEWNKVKVLNKFKFMKHFFYQQFTTNGLFKTILNVIAYTILDVHLKCSFFFSYA